MRNLLNILFMLISFHFALLVHAQNEKVSMDSLVQFYSTIDPLQFNGLEKPWDGDTAIAIQRFTYLINNDIYQSLYLNPNRNTGKGDSGYDYNRTKNYKGLFQYNMYTIYKSRTDGVMRVNYWHTGNNKASLSRSLNVFF